MAAQGTQRAEDNDYDPHSERQVENPTTFLETVLNILKGCIGIGFLALPQAFSKVGLLLGTVGIILLGALGAYCMVVLVRTQYILCKRQRVPYLEYQDSMKAAIDDGPVWLRPVGTVAKGTVNVFYISNQFGTCSAYLTFIAKNIAEVVTQHHPEIAWPIQVYVTILLAVFLAITYVPNMKFFAPFSGFGNLLNLVGICIILYYVFQEFPSPLEREMVAPIHDWALFVGTCLFAVMSVGLVTSGERSMKKPTQFGGLCGVSAVSSAIVVIVYWFVGFMGYVKYGDDSQDSITLNIPTKEPLAQAVQCLFAASIVMSLGLQMYPGIEILWFCYLLPRYKEKPSRTQWLYQYLLRTLCVLLIYGTTCAFGEDLMIMLSLCGVICVSMLGIAFPALMELCVLWPDRLGRWRWIMWKDSVIFLIGVFALILGTYISLYDFITSKLEG